MMCRDCRYFDTEDGKEGYCQEFVYPVNDRCFCNIDAEPPEKPMPDLVEVVRCRDCKHCDYIKYDDALASGEAKTEEWWCGETEVDPNHYCSKGERRE